MFLFQFDTYPQILYNTSFFQNNTSVVVFNTISMIGKNTTENYIPLTDNWISVIIAGITFLGVLVNGAFVYLVLQQIGQTKDIIKISQNQYDSTKEEINNRLRPWVSFLGVSFSRIGGSSPIAHIINRNDDQTKFIALIAYQNFGSFPAKDVNITFRCLNTPNEVNIKEKQNNPEDIVKSGLLMPGQTIETQLLLGADEFNRAQKPYLLLSVLYTDDRLKKGCWSNMLYKCDKHYEFTIEKSWCE